MQGCDQPLAVRFADPKRPKGGDTRLVVHSFQSEDSLSGLVNEGLTSCPAFCSSRVSAFNVVQSSPLAILAGWAAQVLGVLDLAHVRDLPEIGK